MPAKFKPSDRDYPKDARGRRMNTHNPVKKWKHHYLKNQSVETLLEAINSDRTKPKHRTKYRNELTRRGIKTVYVVNGEQIERTRQALLDYAKENGGRFV